MTVISLPSCALSHPPLLNFALQLPLLCLSGPGLQPYGSLIDFDVTPREYSDILAMVRGSLPQALPLWSPVYTI